MMSEALDTLHMEMTHLVMKQAQVQLSRSKIRTMFAIEEHGIHRGTGTNDVEILHNRNVSKNRIELVGCSKDVVSH